MSAREQSVGSGTPCPWIVKEIEGFGAYLRTEKRTEATVRQYTNALKGFLVFVNKPASSLTKADMQAWKVHLAERYCENTMSTWIAAVNQYTERILERQDLKMRPPRQVEKSKIPLTEDEIRRMLKEASRPRKGRKGFPKDFDFSLRDHAAICLMYYGGLRASEATDLRISGLDLDKKRIQIHAGKGKDYSMVNVSDEAVKSVKEYIAHGRPCPSPGCEDLLMLSYNGKRLPRSALWKMVKRVAFWAGIEKNVHPHIFRHSMITHMAERGLSATFIQAQSRHKSLDMVQKYTHLSEQVVRQAYDKTFSGEQVTQAVSPHINEVPASVQPVSMNVSPVTLRERILLKYLDGEIPDDRLDKLLALADHQPAKEHGNSKTTMPGYF
jgi:integrase/recombinase XerD